MIEKIPSTSELTALLGPALFEVWQALCSAIDARYEMEQTWDSGGRNWTYEYKYRRAGKTLCCLYAREKEIGFLVIFGKTEREKFEAIRGTLPDAVCARYDEAKTYHDGKWVMFAPAAPAEAEVYMELLAVKRKPNRK